MLFVAICATSLVWADESGNCGDNVNYTFEESTGTLTISGTGAMDDYDYGSDTPWSDLLITKIVIGNGVTTIGNNAFAQCTSLTDLEISNSVTKIGDYAFENSGLPEVFIPKSVEFIGQNPFRYCSLNSEGIVVEDGNPWYYSDGNCLVEKLYEETVVASCHYHEVDIPDGVTCIGREAFVGCHYMASVTIPSSVTSIAYRAFSGCSALKSIIIPQNVTVIGPEAFSGCYHLTSVMIEAKTPPITTTGFLSSFNNNKVHIYVPAESLEAYKASDYWKDFTNIHSANEARFCGDNVTYTFEESTGTLTISGTGPMDDFYEGNYGENCGPWNAFSSKIKKVIIEDGVTNIGSHAFHGCSGLNSVTIPYSVESIGNGAFQHCSGLTSVEIPNSVTSIGRAAFSHCANLTFNIYDKARYLGNSWNPYHALIGTSSTNIANCKINKDCNVIANFAFDYCTELNAITVGAATPPACGPYGFSNYDIPLYVPAESIEAYRTADVWKNFTNIRGVDDAGICGDNVIWTFEESTGTLTIRGAGPMYDFVDENFGYLSSPSYYGCKIKEIIIEEGVTSIGNGAFESCSELENISIPNTVGSIGWYALGNCKKLTSIEIPESVMSIEWFAFDGCSGLENISASGGRYYSLDNCLIDNYSHMVVLGCKNSVIPEDGVDGIDRLAFSGCTGLTEITIPENVSWIRFDSFCDCTGLTAVTVKATTPPVYETYNYAFSNYDIPLYVPAESIEAYRTADVWANFTNILPIPIPTTGFNEATCEKNEVRKMLIDGTVYVEKDGVRYNLNAQKIR